MTAAFLELVNRSIAAAWSVLAVVLLRLALKRAPRWTAVLLWGIVALRLLCPFSIQSRLSLLPSAEPIPPDSFVSAPVRDDGFFVPDQAAKPVTGSAGAAEIGSPAKPAFSLQAALPALMWSWALGVLGMLVYLLVSWLRLRHRVLSAVRLRDNIYQSEAVRSPFVLGLLRPRIYLPFRLSGQEEALVIAHEQAHIRRCDHLWKPLGFLLLAVNWFNPLLWLAYVLLCRDIEAACDERVIRDFGAAQRADYSQALLSCSVRRRSIAACPLAFGETGVKERVRTVLRYKKPAFWIILLAVIACIVAAVCLLTDPKEPELEGKLAVSMDMAVAEHFAEVGKEADFIATSYQVLGIRRSRGTATVYAWVLYEGFCQESGQPFIDTAAHILTAVTFDTSAQGNSSVYPVLEYWTPRDGSYYASDIRNKFPISLQKAAFDNSCVEQQKAACWAAAEEHFARYLPQATPAALRKLTLDDVLILSQKGKALGWEDFVGYEGRDVGSGLYILRYEIDEQYSLLVGGVPEEAPWYVRLCRSFGSMVLDAIDIRSEDVQGFLRTADFPVTADRTIAVPDAALRWARQCLLQAIREQNDAGREHNYCVTGAELTALEFIPTGTAGLNAGESLYRMEYRLSFDHPERVPLADGMVLDRDRLTEWSSAGQPYLLLRWEALQEETVWTPVCTVWSRTIDEEFSTPELLERYGDKFTAAAALLSASS